jgi:hypothetical protein
MGGVVFIPNPTPISVEMGEVVQNVYADGQFIGNNTFPNLTLNPGNNTIGFTGISNQTLVIDLIKTKYTDGVLPVTIIGNSSVYNGQHLPYFEAALSSLALQTQLNITQALAAAGIPLSAIVGGGSSGSGSSSSAASSQPTSSGQPSGTSSGSQSTATS